MPVVIKLIDRIAAEDILEWPDPSGQEVVFVVLRSAEFEAGAEGIALSFVSVSIRRAGSIAIRCEFDFPQSLVDFCGTILSSMFGYALLRASTAVTFKNKTDETGAASELKKFAGKIYDERRGVIGFGDRVGIMAFDPKRPVPRAFRDSLSAPDGGSVPLPSQFAPGLSRVLNEMGVGEISSQSIFPLITDFVFETFVNTLQHGRPQDVRAARHSTRGISITKIVFGLQDLGRRRMSQGMREFLERVAEMERREKGIFVACISVMDMGEGIQNTLPRASDVEMPNDRLLRAFDFSETRKTNTAVTRGMGLEKVVSAAFRLGARLQISSAGHLLVKDFSLGEDKLPTMQGATFTTMPEHFSVGTCVDLFVPRLLSDIDQRELAL